MSFTTVVLAIVLRSSSSPSFTRDNRIPCVAPANRTEIYAIHADDHVTFCHGEERKKKKAKKVIRYELQSIQDRIRKLSAILYHTQRSTSISTHMHSPLRAYTSKSLQYSKAHPDFRRFVLQSTHASLQII